MAKVEAPMSEVLGGVTLELVITGVRTARLRLWLGTRIMWLGALITGCAVDVRTSEVRQAAAAAGDDGWLIYAEGEPGPRG